MTCLLVINLLFEKFFLLVPIRSDDNLDLNQSHLSLQTLIYTAADMNFMNYKMCSFINQIIYMIFSFKVRQE